MCEAIKDKIAALAVSQGIALPSTSAALDKMDEQALEHLYQGLLAIHDAGQSYRDSLPLDYRANLSQSSAAVSQASARAHCVLADIRRRKAGQTEV